MAIRMTSLVKSKSRFGADTSIFGSILSLGSNREHTCIGGHFRVGMWARMILLPQGELRMSQSKSREKPFYGQSQTVCDRTEQSCVNLIVISYEKIVDHIYLF